MFSPGVGDVPEFLASSSAVVLNIYYSRIRGRGADSTAQIEPHSDPTLRTRAYIALGRHYAVAQHVDTRVAHVERWTEPTSAIGADSGGQP